MDFACCSARLCLWCTLSGAAVPPFFTAQSLPCRTTYRSFLDILSSILQACAMRFRHGMIATVAMMTWIGGIVKFTMSKAPCNLWNLLIYLRNVLRPPALCGD